MTAQELETVRRYLVRRATELRAAKSHIAFGAAIGGLPGQSSIEAKIGALHLVAAVVDDDMRDAKPGFPTGYYCNGCGTWRDVDLRPGQWHGGVNVTCDCGHETNLWMDLQFDGPGLAENAE